MPQNNKKFTFSLKNTSLLLCLSLGLNACQSRAPTMPVEHIQYTHGMQLMAEAQSLPANQRAARLLPAASLFIEQASWDKAAQALKMLPEDLTPAQHDKAVLAWIQVHLAKHQTKTAHRLLMSLAPNQLTAKQNQKVLALHAQLLQQQHRWHESLLVETKLTPLLESTQQKQEQAQRIWLTLQNLPLPYPQTKGDLQAWYELANLIVAPHVPTQPALSSWQAAHPQHPGNFLLKHAADAPPLQPPKTICLLLPHPVAENTEVDAIKQGFITSYYHIPPSERPNVFIHYHRPDEVKTLAPRQHHCQVGIAVLSAHQAKWLTAHPPQQPMITLGEYHAGKNTYALRPYPLDLAKVMTKQAQSMGIQRAIIMAPDDRHGRQLSLELNTAWQKNGGKILTNLALAPGAEHTTGIKNLLELNLSEQRKNKLEKLLWQEVNFTPRRRQDIDGFFLLSTNQEAQSIAPLLSFFYAGDIPVLMHPIDHTTSELRSFNKDLNGIWLYDIPWVTKPIQTLPTTLRHSLLANQTSPLFNQNILYYAWGRDVLHLAMQLNKLENFPLLSFQGASGDLRVNSKHEIVRTQMWAKITPNGMREYHLG